MKEPEEVRHELWFAGRALPEEATRSSASKHAPSPAAAEDTLLLGAPLGELTAAFMTALGLHVLATGDGLVAGLFLVAGLLLTSVCRAGITIAEFSSIGRLRGHPCQRKGEEEDIVRVSKQRHARIVATTSVHFPCEWDETFCLFAATQTIRKRKSKQAKHASASALRHC